MAFIFNLDELLERIPPEGQYVFSLIQKGHDHFRRKEKVYKTWSMMLRVSLLLLAMANSIVLGLRGFINIDKQVMVGVILSSIITFLSAIIAYFNIEHYWMRNVRVHIKYNILRDKFLFDVSQQQLDAKKIEEYKQELEKVQNDNIEYWSKAIKRI